MKKLIIISFLSVYILEACNIVGGSKIEVVEDNSLCREDSAVCLDKIANGFVPDKETAAKIAVAVWSPIYGEEVIKQQKPYLVRLTNDSVWIVEGTLNENNFFMRYFYHGHFLGGTAYIEIRKSDGKILRVIHGE